MYLSQLKLNAQTRAVWRDLADRYELHRTLMSAFPTTLPPDERVLYRVEQQRDTPDVQVLIQSQQPPSWDISERLSLPGYLKTTPQIRRVQVEVAQGNQFPFRLQANPTIKRDGKRHGLVTDETLLDWLTRKADQHGFRLILEQVRIAKLGKLYGQKRRQTWHAVQFDGGLEVTDAAQFTAALINGIGSGKAFGFGLLSIQYRRYA